MSSEDAAKAEFDRLLTYLKASRGFDFSSYKPTTLQRRIQKRMQTVGVEGYTAYLDYLEVHQDEFQHLFNTILINVTSFFRDAEAWDYLREHVLPTLIQPHGTDDSLRIWVAGCASGEEAYSLSMVMAEAMGREAFRDRVKIYATDLDEDALNSSRIAAYAERQVESVPAEFLDKYFEHVGDRYVFDRDLRRSVVFGRHDLINDAPISRVDLLLCRNTLMYFNAEVQERIASRFNFALNDGGYLFLGKAETLLTHTSLFVPVDLKNRVFSKVSRGRVRDRSFMFPLPKSNGDYVDAAWDPLVTETAFEHGIVASIVLDKEGLLVRANERARSTFGLNLKDLGRPFQDLELSYRPVELRSGIEQAVAQKRSIVHRDVVWTPSAGAAATLEVRAIPLFNERKEVTGVMVTFEDVTQFKRLQTELMTFNQELETAYEEVQSTNEELQTTNEELQSTVEELETTNEELQSTNEELETMNEELQSANEELETINEELQSANEELETINEELRNRSLELNRANSFLESVLAGLSDGVIVLDADLQVLAWNYGSEDLWGLRADEVIGKHVFNLDIGLPVESLRSPIRACLANREAQRMKIDATNRRGRSVECQIVCTPLHGALGEVRGVIILTGCGPS